MVEQGLVLPGYSLQEMPYDSVQDLPAHVKKLPDKAQRQWMHVWNSSYRTCMAKDEGGAASCESEAFAKANGVVKGAEMPDDNPVTSKFYDSLIRLEKSDPKASYRQAADNEGWQCGDCRFFDPAWRSCSLVEGTIESTATCNLWTPKLPSQDNARIYSEQSVQLFIDVAKVFKQDLSKPTWIPFLPTPGTFSHPVYGLIEITPERNSEFVENFKKHVYQEHIPLDAEHETKLSGAVGWIKDMRLNADGSADAFVEWTDRGRTLVGGDTPQFRYVSPEWFDSWTDPATSTVYSNVIAGGAITTRPFFKDKVLRALVASERGGEVVAAEASMKTCANCGKKYSSNMADCPSCGSSKTTNEGGNNVGDKDPKDPKTYAEGSPELEALLAAKVAEAKTAAEADVQKKIDDAVKAASEKTDEQKFAEVNTRLTAAEQRATAAETANATLTTTLTEIKNAERHRRFADLVTGKGGANDGGPWVGDKDKHVSFLEGLADKVGESDPMFVSYIEQQNAAAAQVAQAGLFTQAGSSGAATGGSGAQEKLDGLARAAMEKDPELSFSDAEAQVLRTEAGSRLYAEINAAHPGTPRA